ncbi:MAG: TonB-dependent receptor [Flavobacteriaceae bacterium]|jgi:vitamin B12 transporter|nr:TonB-dependent receptor [Flavobacteriaceae bacterium]
MRYILAVMLCISTVHAQELLDEVVVSDTRTSKPRKNSGKAVIHISAETIAQNKGISLAQLLNQYAGIYISGAQLHPGQNLSYFIRGGNNRQVLIRIDGVVVSDPSQIESDFDLRLVALDQIATIEVVKGASSSLYGSGAATAIIDITTKNELTQKTKLTVAQEWGTQNTHDQKLGNLADASKQFVALERQVGNLAFATSIQRIAADGMSSVTGTETDPIVKENIQFSVQSQYTGPWAWSAYLQRDVFDANFDSTYPSFVDADYAFLSKQQRIGFAPSYTAGKSAVQAQFSWADSSRSYADSYPSDYTAAIFTTDLTWRHRHSDELTLLGGLFYQDIDSDFKNAFSGESYTHNNLAVFVSGQWQHAKGYAVHASVRNTIHSEFGTHQTFTINPFYVKGLSSGGYLKFFGSWATSFIAPSQYKLYSTQYGNTALTPEENQTLELGVEQVMENRRITVVAFQREEDNFVDFVSLPNFAGQYRNRPGIFKVRGVEAEANWSLKNWNINTNYTFTEKLDQAPLRLPKHTANLGVRYVTTKSQWGVHWRYIGSRYDLNQSFAQEKLDAYALVDVRIAFPDFIGNTTASLAITNVFDVAYTEIFGFTTQGRNLNIALRYAF